jgi:Ca-activated chloride channel family protein
MFKGGVSLLLLFATSVPAQVANPPDGREFTLYAASQLVVLNVGVQDSHGANIRGLKARDFRVFEDGHLQTAKQFAAEDRPVTIGIVVDTSGSMRTKQAEVATAALSFVRANNPGDETFVINFNDHAFPGLPSNIAFSNDPRQLRAALLGRKPEGKTALYDALALAADHLAKGKWENKALLLISDGGDNNSTHSLTETVRAVQISGATVYSIGLFDPEEPEHNLGTLHRLSKMTGGEAFTPTDVSEIGSLCLRIAEDIRASYTIAYTPPRPDQHTTSRKIKVIAIAPGLGKLAVRTRTSYILADH